jgi:hypothetical protein
LLLGAQQEQKPAYGDTIPTPNGCFHFREICFLARIAVERLRSRG